MTDIILIDFFEPVMPFIIKMVCKPAEGVAKIEIDVFKIQIEPDVVMQYFKEDAVIEFEGPRQILKATFKDWNTGFMVYNMFQKYRPY